MNIYSPTRNRLVFLKWYSNEIDLLIGVEENIKSLERITELEIFPNMTFTDVRIKYRLFAHCNVKLAIYNLLGQEIITLINTKKLSGNYVIRWS